jgi:carbonic anhydrase/acetyltransferase-like protein (isoleucine patch superfamily)
MRGLPLYILWYPYCRANHPDISLVYRLSKTDQVTLSSQESNMTQISKGPLSQISRDFVPKPFQADKEDCYYFRNQQNIGRNYRSLTSEEIEILVKNNNTAEVWDKIQVSEHFNPSLVRNCDFWGMVRLGDLTPAFLEFHQLRLPVGLYNCSIISCDIGDNVAMRNVHHLSHYIIGNHVILFNIQEMLTVNQAKFGNGIVKKGESEEVRIWLEIANENGGRSILPFKGILPADAALWARFRDNEDLLHALKTMTDARGDTRRGYYGSVGDNSVIKNSRIIKDVMIGAHCYIKGANKLKNLTIQSSAEEPSQIGEGVELVNGIIGFNNRIFYGVKAVRFVTCRNVQLKYGARLINSFLGPNSTVSCCEILNNLVYGFHEQHHNNSFLIAATIEGQSNIAAGATIGSNHNSRANDGEIIARRGFWPGLESNFKHNCKFASFTLIAKGSYQKEMYIPLPFSLVATTDKANTIQLLPAYWFKHNMYALERNAWKFDKRDKRHHKEQPIETDYLAPDTAEEILSAMQFLEDKISGHLGHPVERTDLLENLPVQSTSSLEVTEFVKKGIALVRKPLQAYRLYHLMLDYYGCKQLYNALVAVLRQQSGAGVLEELKRRFKSQPQEWFNLGGQPVQLTKIKRLQTQITNRTIKSWNSIHSVYQKWQSEYADEKMSHGIHTLVNLYGQKLKEIDTSFIISALQSLKEHEERITKDIIQSRKKDYDCPFRQMVYHSKKEMVAVLGRPQDNTFVKERKKITQHRLRDIDEKIAIVQSL